MDPLLFRPNKKMSTILAPIKKKVTKINLYLKSCVENSIFLLSISGNVSS